MKKQDVNRWKHGCAFLNKHRYGESFESRPIVFDISSRLLFSLSKQSLLMMTMKMRIKVIINIIIPIGNSDDDYSVIVLLALQKKIRWQKTLDEEK